MRGENTCTGLHAGDCGVFATVQVENMYTTVHRARYEKMSYSDCWGSLGIDNQCCSLF